MAHSKGILHSFKRVFEDVINIYIAAVKYEKLFIKAENVSSRRGISVVNSRALALEGGNLNKPPFKSLNTRGVILWGRRWLKVRIDRAHASLYFS